MTSTAATTAPAVATQANGTLPPSLPADFGASTSTGGGSATGATATQPATAGTSTSFVATTNAVGGGYQTIPAPGSCTMPPPVLQEPGTGTPVQNASGGGGTAGIDTAALAPVLQQLTSVIGQLGTLVGGVSGGGAPAKAPEKAPDKAAANTTQGGGATHAPASSTVAGANGSPAANATQGAAAVQGGGASDANMEALVKALQGVIETLTALIATLRKPVEGGGPGKDPAQVPPPSAVKGDSGPGKEPSKVDGAKGGPVQQAPAKEPAKAAPPTPPAVGGANGGPVKQTPAQVPAPPKPAVAGASGGPAQQAPAQKPAPSKPAVAGASGGPVQQAPAQKPAPSKPAVAGANGGPVQQTPVQSPAQKPAVGGANGGPVQQSPTQEPTVGGANGGPVQEPAKPAMKGNVVLDNDDNRWSAKLVAAGGKSEHSVELWGDPHVVITVDGKAERFDIGHGAGKATLFDGTTISWDTYDKGDKNQFILRDFKVDSAGVLFDRSVTTRDRDGDKGDQMGLATALTDAHLTEFATALRTMQGPMSDPLKNGSWTSPKLIPTQQPTQQPAQQPAA